MVTLPMTWNDPNYPRSPLSFTCFVSETAEARDVLLGNTFDWQVVDVLPNVTVNTVSAVNITNAQLLPSKQWQNCHNL